MKHRWKGYVNPHYDTHRKHCPHCDGSGNAPDAKFLSDAWYQFLAREMFGAFYGDSMAAIPPPEVLRHRGHPEVVIKNIERARRLGFKTATHWGDKLDERDVAALVKENRLHDFTHTWSKAKGWRKKKKFRTPTPDDVAEWSSRGIGHDAINQWVVLKDRCRRLRIKRVCEHCRGDGSAWDSPENKRLAEKWERQEPPAGDGWQMWETTSEGSPMSPVFDAPEKLARWLADTNASSFGDSGATYEQWLGMIAGPGWAPSGVRSPSTGLVSGVEAVAAMAKEA
jgi:hypothetical protein